MIAFKEEGMIILDTETTGLGDCDIVEISMIDRVSGEDRLGRLIYTVK